MNLDPAVSWNSPPCFGPPKQQLAAVHFSQGTPLHTISLWQYLVGRPLFLQWLPIPSSAAVVAKKLWLSLRTCSTRETIHRWLSPSGCRVLEEKKSYWNNMVPKNNPQNSWDMCVSHHGNLPEFFLALKNRYCPDYTHLWVLEILFTTAISVLHNYLNALHNVIINNFDFIALFVQFISAKSDAGI